MGLIEISYILLDMSHASQSQSTKHTAACQRVFKRYDVQCPRCQELIAGQAPRDGWQKEHFEKKRRDESNRVRWIDEHFKSEAHLSGKCGPVCTYGDW